MSERAIQIIYLLYHRSDDLKQYVTAADLASLLGLGRKTILMTMAEVKHILLERGAYIEVKKSRGYMLKITDRQLFNAHFSVPFAQNMISNKTSSDRNERIIHIARKLVSQIEPITVEQISDSLYLSKSAIKNDLKMAYSILTDYDLKVKYIKNKGLLPIGAEKDIRLCMTDLIGMNYNFFLLKEISDASYQRWIYCDMDEATRIRRTLLAVLKQYKFQIRDIDTQRIAAYLIVMRNRCRSGYFYAVWEKEGVLPEGCIEYEVVNTLFDTLQKLFQDFDVPVLERQFVAKLLYCYKEVDKANTNEALLSEASHHCQQIAAYLLKVDASITFSSFFEDRLQLLLIRLLLKKQFRLWNSRHFFDTKVDAYIFDSPLSYAIAYDIKVMLEEALQVCFGAEDVYKLNLILYTEIHLFEVPHRKLKLLTHSFSGMDDAKLLIKHFDDKFHNYIASNQAIELYEVRDVKQNEYDCIILSVQSFSYREMIPPFFTKLTTLHADLPRFMDQFIIPIFQYEDYITEDIKIFDHQKYTDEIGTLHQICKQAACSSEEQRALFDDLYRKYYECFLTGSDEIVILFGNFTYVKKNCMLLYRYSHSIKWKGHEIKMVLFISDCFQSKETMKILKIITNSLMEKRHYRTALYTTDAPKSLFKEIIENAIKTLYAKG